MNESESIRRQRVIRIDPADNVGVDLDTPNPGEAVRIYSLRSYSVENRDAGAFPPSGGARISRIEITVCETVPCGHKVALGLIDKGENAIKYGFPIGHAKTRIDQGSWVHIHNLGTNLSGLVEYGYRPQQQITSRKRTRNEESGFRQIALFKDGIIG